jgi:uncharacterized protein YkwD
MPTTTDTSAAHTGATRRRPVRRLLGFVAVTAAVLVLTGCLSEQGQRAFDLLNADRQANGVAELVNDLDLNAKAQQWADHMAATGILAHSQLVVPEGSTRVAENVGYAGSVDDIQRRLMASAGHRANILDHRLTKVGIGVTVDGSGRVWLVQLFAN